MNHAIFIQRNFPGLDLNWEMIKINVLLFIKLEVINELKSVSNNQMGAGKLRS